MDNSKFYFPSENVLCYSIYVCYIYAMYVCICICVCMCGECAYVCVYGSWVVCTSWQVFQLFETLTQNKDMDKNSFTQASLDFPFLYMHTVYLPHSFSKANFGETVKAFLIFSFEKPSFIWTEMLGQIIFGIYTKWTVT